MRSPCIAWAKSGSAPVRRSLSRQIYKRRCAIGRAISKEIDEVSKQALLDVDDILVLHVVIQGHAFLFHFSGGVAPMANDAALGAFARDSASRRKRLHDRHAALKRILVGLLDLSIDVEQRLLPHEYRVAAEEFDVLPRISVRRHFDDIDLAPEWFAIAFADHRNHLAA